MADNEGSVESTGGLGIEALRERRRLVFNASANQPPAEPAGAVPADSRAIALSGGGIRSATFSLGVMQAIAQAPARGEDDPLAVAPTARAGSLFARSLLSRFDYLSTVSGGGYLGSFVASLFIPRRLVPPGGNPPHAHVDADIEAAADLAVQALAIDPPGRISSGASGSARTPSSFPLAWLRENGRYLSPTGGGDMAYAAALDLRNWVAIHYVVGTLLVVLFAAMAFARASVWYLMDTDFLVVHMLFGIEVWLSPILWLALLPMLVGALPVGLAFWFTYPSRGGGPKAWNSAVVGIIAIAIALVLLLAADLSTQPLAGAGFAALMAGRRLPLLVGVVVLALSLVWYAIDLHAVDPAAKAAEAVSRQRVLATRQLTAWLQVTLVLLLLGVIETVGQTIYLDRQSEGGLGAGLWGTSGAAAALAWITKTVSKLASSTTRGSWLKKLPLGLIGGAVGILIFALIAVAWSYTVTWIVWDGEPPTLAGRQGTVLVVCLVLLVVSIGLAWVTGQFPGFINLSSLQSFYSARLTRAYLGASNGTRAAANPGDSRLSAAEPAPGDDVTLADYWDSAAKQPTSLAPLHLINVTLAKTVDPAEQLVQRDRKGQPLCVSPLGFAIDGARNPFRRVGPDSQIQHNLSVGQWVGVSGAAASTGLGRQTSLGMSLLLGAANVRLGTWWQSNAQGVATREIGLRDSFKTQAYLLDEFGAKFYGLRRPWQYMTDGGHFENLALYELLRPERQLRFVIAVDATADPAFGFADLANLIRLVRIDHQVEVAVQRGFADPQLADVFGAPEDFRQPGGAPHCPCALLLKATHAAWARPCWIVLIKPRVLPGSPEDVRQYAIAHPEFPHQSTADQFFDEAQWESYRKLGLDNMRRVLAPNVRLALQTLTEIEMS